MSIIIHAPNIHQGGGLRLLNTLLQELPTMSFLTLDSRFPISEDIISKFDIFFVKPNIWGRFKSELYIKSIAKRGDLLLCMGNLPPIFPSKADVTLFIQNRYCIDKTIPLNEFNIKIRLRITLERLWFWYGLKNTSRFIVQNKTMQRILKLKTNYNAEILPFFSRLEHSDQKNLIKNSSNKFDFVYVATGEPHKNHRNLIEAWVILASDGVYPSLCLTLDESTHQHLCQWIDSISKKSHLKIKNYGVLPQEDMVDLYKNSKALIFPSLTESFGLPLVEAAALELPIIASELDFVWDVVSPDETFDPTSSISISRAVRRFLGQPEPRTILLNSKNFLKKIIKGYYY